MVVLVSVVSAAVVMRWWTVGVDAIAFTFVAFSLGLRRHTRSAQ